MALKGEDLARPTYRCLTTIGSGANGICRRATHEVFGTEIVQKTISLLDIPDGVANEPALLKEFNHANIVKVHEAQYDNEFPGLKTVTFITDYFEGGSVYDALMDDHYFSMVEATAIVKQIADALAYMHDLKGYLHRDVKPANILLDSSRKQGCLADLGSAAKLVDGCTQNHGGTPLYLDPAATAAGVLTIASDVYSLGVLFVELLSGRFPYEAVEMADVNARLASGKRALTDEHYALPPEVPRELRLLINKMIDPRPAKRPAGADAVHRKLTSMAAKIPPWVRSVDPIDGISWRLKHSTHRRTVHYKVTLRGEQGDAASERCGIEVLKRINDGRWNHVRALERGVSADCEQTVSAVLREVERQT